MILTSWLAKKAEIRPARRLAFLVWALGTTGTRSTTPTTATSWRRASSSTSSSGSGSRTDPSTRGTTRTRNEDEAPACSAAGRLLRTEPGFRLKASMFPGGHAESRM